MKKRINKAEQYPLVLPLLRKISSDPCSEFKFHPDRKWRADFAIPSHMLLIEIEGGVWTGGRHTRGSGFIGDMEKYNAATVLGYRLLRFTPSDVKAKSITAFIDIVKKCLSTDAQLTTSDNDGCAPCESIRQQ